MLTDTLQRADIAGETITQEIMKESISQRRIRYSLLELRDFVHDIKHNHIFISLDYDAIEAQESYPNLSITYLKGNHVILDRFRYRAPEVLFHMAHSNRRYPLDLVSSFGHEDPMTNLFGRIPLDLTRRIFDIGFGDLKVICPTQREISVWKGGSIMANSIAHPQEAWFTIEEYEEKGSQGIRIP